MSTTTPKKMEVGEEVKAAVTHATVPSKMTAAVLYGSEDLRIEKIDVPALRGEGWRPYPFREFIVKVHSRCDLSCDYCYMYEMADQSWRDQPRTMSEETADMTARRIGEHARAHELTEIMLILHGGEPLLAGRELISRLVMSTRRSVRT